MRVQTFSARLGNMRKDTDWIVYPPSKCADQPNMRLIQSDHRICEFDINTRKGMLSKACSSGAYFIHLNKMLGAVEIKVPQDIVDKVIMLQPRSGDQVGPGMTIA